MLRKRLRSLKEGGRWGRGWGGNCKTNDLGGGKEGGGGGGAFFFFAAGAGARFFLLRVRGRVFFFAAGAGATHARSLTHRGGPRKKHPKQKSTHNKKKHGFRANVCLLGPTDALYADFGQSARKQASKP